jgi:hypothetical protein
MFYLYYVVGWELIHALKRTSAGPRIAKLMTAYREMNKLIITDRD